MRVVAIWKKEIKSFFNSPIAYIFMALFLAATAASFLVFTSRGPKGEFRGNFFTRGEASVTDYFAVFPLVLSIAVPMLCMRLWADEHKSGTIEVLMTLPVRAWEVVFGKFLAMATMILATLVLSLSIPISVDMLAVDGLDWGPVQGSYIGAFLLGCAYCSVSLFASAFTREQVVALLVSAFVCFVLALAGRPDWDIFTPAALSPIAEFVGFTVRFQSIAKGVVDLRDMFYFLSFTALFVFLNVTVVDVRRRS